MFFCPTHHHMTCVHCVRVFDDTVSPLYTHRVRCSARNNNKNIVERKVVRDIRRRRRIERVKYLIHNIIIIYNCKLQVQYPALSAGMGVWGVVGRFSSDYLFTDFSITFTEGQHLNNILLVITLYYEMFKNILYAHFLW